MQLDNRKSLLMGRQRSQSLIEFSLSLVALIMLVSGLLDLGRLYFIYTAMEDIVGEGALYMSIDPQCTTSLSTAGSASCADPNNTLFRMSKAGSGILAFDTLPISTSAEIDAVMVESVPSTTTDLPAGAIRIRLCYPSPYSGTPMNVNGALFCPDTVGELGTGANGVITVTDTVYVEMHYGFKLLTPFMPAIAGINPLRLSVAAVAYALIED